MSPRLLQDLVLSLFGTLMTDAALLSFPILHFLLHNLHMDILCCLNPEILFSKPRQNGLEVEWMSLQTSF